MRRALVGGTWLRFAAIVLMSWILVTSGAEAKRSKRRPKSDPVVDPATVEAPKAGEVCFSPDEPCDIKLVKFIQAAQKTLDVAIYDLNLDQVVHNLAVQSKKLPVRVIVDQRQSKGDHSLVSILVKAGVNVRFGRQRGIMHNKFIIRDGGALETGSFNFTNHAARANNENQIYLDSPDVLNRYKARFEQIWAKARPVPGAGTPPTNAEESEDDGSD